LQIGIPKNVLRISDSVRIEMSADVV